MKNKIVGILVMMLLILNAISVTATMRDSTNIDNNKMENYEGKIDDDIVDLEHERFYMIHKFRIRTYLVYLPSYYDEAAPMPLVITLHGYPNTAENSSQRFGVSEKAEEEGFIAVYPDGCCPNPDFRGWNFEGFGNIFSSDYWRGVDDVGFFGKLFKRLQKQFNIDEKRIYVAGHSNGAMMTYRLASEFSDTIAAIASNGGSIGRHTHSPDDPLFVIPEPENPVSVVLFHGKWDYIVPYDGGYGAARDYYWLSVADAVSFWVEANGCNPDPYTEVSDSGNIVTDRYSNGNAGTEILLYTVNNGFHVWFGIGTWEDPDGEISTTDEMWNFFEAHPKQ